LVCSTVTPHQPDTHTGILALLLFLVLCAHSQLNPFYHPFYPDITHMRKDTRPLPLFCTATDRKLGRAWEQGYRWTPEQLEGSMNMSARDCGLLWLNTALCVVYLMLPFVTVHDKSSPFCILK